MMIAIAPMIVVQDDDHEDTVCRQWTWHAHFVNAVVVDSILIQLDSPRYWDIVAAVVGHSRVCCWIGRRLD